MVCAGTGSGKTLSFYLPAFISISQTIDTHRWTRCLAIYPRNELLKDQLSEAFKQARKLDSVFHSTGKRKLTIGTLFGATPEHEGSFNYSDPPPGWTLISGGTVCPYLRCPSGNCEGQMIWRTEDRERKLHRLRCTRCTTATEDDELILTRQR
ncbi:MAG: DEAD/DEAH box helicase, partial [Planctomyces sp.]